MEENNKKDTAKPNEEEKSLDKIKDKDKVDKVSGCGCLVSILVIIICIVAFHSCGSNKKVDKNNTKQTTVQQKQQVKKEETKKAENAEAEAKKVQEEMPKINFKGVINPQLAQRGEKVVITVEIENTDNNKTIKGIKMIFSNKNLLEKGLVITNIMNGGTRDGRDVFWNIEIPPKEKRAFNIVASANEPGEYETAITFGEYNGFVNYQSPDGKDELDGKLVVTP